MIFFPASLLLPQRRNGSLISAFDGNETKEEMFLEADILEIARESCSEVKG